MQNVIYKTTENDHGICEIVVIRHSDIKFIYDYIKM